MRGGNACRIKALIRFGAVRGVNIVNRPSRLALLSSAPEAVSEGKDPLIKCRSGCLQDFLEDRRRLDAEGKVGAAYEAPVACGQQLGAGE